MSPSTMMSPPTISSLEGIPLPAGAPDAGACIRIERPEPGLAVLVLDPPHRPSIAVLDVPLLRDLAAALETIELDSELQGLVITGRAPLSFAAGADVDAIAGVKDPQVAERLVRFVHGVFNRIERLGRESGGRLRTVAAVGGPVPGGACELSLCCDRIVLADDPKTRIGLPEVKLGIFPAWGGTQRLPRRVGLPAALQAILTGRLHDPRQALRIGLVDRLTKPAYLGRVATDIATGRAKCPRRRRGWRALVIDKNPLVISLIRSQTEKKLLQQTKGHYPAPFVAMRLVLDAARTNLATGLARELEEIPALVVSPVSKNLVRIFQLSEEAKKLGNGPGGEPAERFGRAAVIGAGVMGGGIASLLAQKRVDVRLRDLELGQLDSAQREHESSVNRLLKRRRLARNGADAALDRFEVTTAAVGFGRCDFAIEAVAERLDVKRAVLGELASLMPDDAVLATNTSSLSVSEIAAQVPRPHRVVGMHFFNPVARMPLVEVVRGRQTSAEVVARTARLALDLGKTPVVVRDVPGFLVNRVLGPYLDEAVRLLESGADMKTVDAAIENFGMPMGPYELLDEIGLDIAAHAGASLEEAYGVRMTKSGFLAPLVGSGDLGKKTGAGLYTYTTGKNGRPVKGAPNPEVPSPTANQPVGPDEAVDRLILALVNEAARCLEEEVVASARELDLAMIFGTGFAPFRGGPLRYADQRGLAAIVARLRILAESPGVALRTGGPQRFAPAPLLLRLAEEGEHFHG